MNVVFFNEVVAIANAMTGRLAVGLRNEGCSAGVRFVDTRIGRRE